MAARGGLRELHPVLLRAADGVTETGRGHGAHLAAAHLVHRRLLRAVARRAVLLLGHGFEPGRSDRGWLAAGRLLRSARAAWAVTVQFPPVNEDHRPRPVHADAN